MSYRRTWTRRFFADELDIEAAFPFLAPYRCNQHIDPETGRSICFVAAATPSTSSGTWRLREKIDIHAVMSGTKQKIIGFSMKGLFELGFMTGISKLQAEIGIEVDGAKIWQSPSTSHNEGSWAINNFTPNKDIAGYINLDVYLWQMAAVYTGGLIIHDAELTLQCEYFVDIPPETADVKIDVINKESGALVSQAYVALMSGAVVMADGYTDGGTITFSNIDEGSYTLKIPASGYHPFDMPIEVAPPSVWYIAKIVPIPAEPLPWWVIPLAVGSVAIGGLVILKRPKPSAPVIVIK